MYYVVWLVCRFGQLNCLWFIGYTTHHTQILTALFRRVLRCRIFIIKENHKLRECLCVCASVRVRVCGSDLARICAADIQNSVHNDEWWRAIVKYAATATLKPNRADTILRILAILSWSLVAINLNICQPVNRWDLVLICRTAHTHTHAKVNWPASEFIWNGYRR